MNHLAPSGFSSASNSASFGGKQESEAWAGKVSDAACLRKVFQTMGKSWVPTGFLLEGSRGLKETRISKRSLLLGQRRCWDARGRDYSTPRTTGSARADAGHNEGWGRALVTGGFEKLRLRKIVKET